MINISEKADSQIYVKENVRILQLAEGSLPISNRAWLSANRPVESDPASAKNISAIGCNVNSTSNQIAQSLPMEARHLHMMRCH